jgi:hypothetical protein
MKSQKLKAYRDFLRRAEIIPETLLVITDNNSQACNRAIKELKSLDYEIPFYELNLSDNPQLKEELASYYDQNNLPSFIYFHGKNMINKKMGFDEVTTISNFLNSSKSLFQD